MTTLVNIGLATKRGQLSPAHAFAAIRAVTGVQTLIGRVYCSDSEPTLVAELRSPMHAAAAYELARFLDQDAVAQFDGRDGQLYGPNAAAWGQFDPSKFIDLTGRRLGAAQ